MHDPAVYPDPGIVDPERYLRGSNSDAINPDPRLFAFGYGRRYMASLLTLQLLIGYGYWQSMSRTDARRGYALPHRGEHTRTLRRQRCPLAGWFAASMGGCYHLVRRLMV